MNNAVERGVVRPGWKQKPWPRRPAAVVVVVAVVALLLRNVFFIKILVPLCFAMSSFIDGVLCCPVLSCVFPPRGGVFGLKFSLSLSICFCCGLFCGKMDCANFTPKTLYDSAYSLAWDL